MASNFYILTNNPDVAKNWPGLAQFEELSVAQIYKSVRDAVHLGSELISHPLAGSLKPNESPYKSVLLSKNKGSHDRRSLEHIEEAMAVLNRLGDKQRSYSPEVLEDFRVIDMDLVQSAMAGLPSRYHQ